MRVHACLLTLFALAVAVHMFSFLLAIGALECHSHPTKCERSNVLWVLHPAFPAMTALFYVDFCTGLIFLLLTPYVLAVYRGASADARVGIGDGLDAFDDSSSGDEETGTKKSRRRRGTADSDDVSLDAMRAFIKIFSSASSRMNKQR